MAERGRWDALFDDLAGELAGEQARDFDAEVRDRIQVEQARQTLADRLVAHQGAAVTVTTQGAGVVRGVVTDAAKDWLLVGDTLIPRTAVLAVEGLGSYARSPDARPEAEAAIGHVLRQLADEHDEVTCTFVDGQTLRGLITRVGRDYVDVGDRAIPFRAIATIRP